MTEAETERLVARLRDGNARFLELVRADPARFVDLARGQRPFAVVLACADSRVAPEIVFDTDLGDLFVVRVAGSVASAAGVASIEYAISQLGSKLIIVLAHEGCGAVKEAIAGGHAGRNLRYLLEHIAPAVKEVGADGVDAVARRSAELNADRLITDSKILSEAVAHDGVQIVTAFHHFTTGEVEFD